MPQGSLWERSTRAAPVTFLLPSLGGCSAVLCRACLQGASPVPQRAAHTGLHPPQRSSSGCGEQPRTHTGRCNSHMWDNPAWSQVTAIPRLSVLVFASTTFPFCGVLPRESKRPAAAAPQLHFCRGRSALQGKGVSGQGEEGGKGKGHKGQGVGVVLETAADPTGR